jgi:hypothetical protein
VSAGICRKPASAPYAFIRKAHTGQNRLLFALYVRNDNRRPRLVKLIATCSALDNDTPHPAIAMMLSDEH